MDPQRGAVTGHRCAHGSARQRPDRRTVRWIDTAAAIDAAMVDALKEFGVYLGGNELLAAR